MRPAAAGAAGRYVLRCDRRRLPVPARRLAGRPGGQEHLRRRLRSTCATSSSDPDVVHALRLTRGRRADRGRHQHGVRRRHLAPARALPVPRPPRRSAPSSTCPLSVSPVVVGLSLVLVYGGRDGWFGPWLEDAGFQVIFATPGIVMATAFVSLPLVGPRGGAGARGDRHRAGAGGAEPRRQRLADVPAHHAAVDPWAVVYGVVLSLARSLGEFGAVKVVSGNVARRDPTATLVVEEKYLNFDQGGAYATAFLLALVSVACIVVVSLRSAPRRSEIVSIEVRNVGKRFGDFVALDDVSVEHPDRAAHRPARPERRRQVDAAAHHRRARAGRRRHGRDRGRRRHRPAAAEAQRRLRVPALRRVQAPVGAPQRGVRARDPQAPEGRDPRARRRAARARAPRAVRRPPAVAALGRPAPAHGAGPGARGRARRCCCSTSRSARSTPRCARSCATGCGACTTRCTSPPCSSPTTRRRRSRSPTRSW